MRFEAISGLRVNMDKSELNPSGKGGKHGRLGCGTRM